ncbi:hypothetical protein [Frankia sp. AgKG'84/4]|uniref:hypothetical protein n=1 Tax=Frankia sp. AgKG'84/4 TaxID=573490 RepID=UPI002029E616|nr:hypothetical protein [Frankia sp. AgKG'84/4]MCL9794130.1 hypothetical protein [Frankia sp. AgKG'84/4]
MNNGEVNHDSDRTGRRDAAQAGGRPESVSANAASGDPQVQGRVALADRTRLRPQGQQQAADLVCDADLVGAPG